MVDAALLRYLAVAHFGRGRGDWAQGESPPFWKDVIARSLAPHRDALVTLWASRGARDSREADPIAAAALASAIEAIVHDAASRALEHLYGEPASMALRESAHAPALISA
jgi:hypothetical protein